MRYIVIFLLLANLAFLGWDRFLAQPVTVPEVVPGRTLLNNGLTLLSEFDARPAEPARQPAGGTRLCLHVGDFPSVDDANSFVALMRSQGLEARLHLTGELMEPRYRVYIAPLSSQAVATITLDGLTDVLAQAGLEIETYIVTRGLLGNAIALGVYEELDTATAVEQQVTALGYRVELEPIPRSSGAIQVELRGPDSSLADSPEWPEITDFAEYLAARENVCQTIAQGSQFP